MKIWSGCGQSCRLSWATIQLPDMDRAGLYVRVARITLKVVTDNMTDMAREVMKGMKENAFRAKFNSAMVGNTATKTVDGVAKKYHYCECGRAKRSGDCANKKRYPQDKVEHALLKYIESETIRPGNRSDDITRDMVVTYLNRQQGRLVINAPVGTRKEIVAAYVKEATILGKK